MAKLNVMDYGVVGDGVTDDYAAIMAVLAMVGKGSNNILFPSADYRISAPIADSAPGDMILEGEGPGENGSRFLCDFTTGDSVTLSGKQFAAIKNLGTKHIVKPTSGYGFNIENNFDGSLENVRVWNGFNGVKVVDSAAFKLKDISLRNLLGTRGFYYGSNGGAGSYGLSATDIEGDNPYPHVYTKTVTWSNGLNVIVGDVIFKDSKIYQCSQAGACGATGPTGIPGTNSTDCFTTEITDGSAKWKFVCADLTWFDNDSKGYSLNIKTAHLLNGRVGFQSNDTLNTGSSYPADMNFFGLNCDHNHFQAANFAKGALVKMFGGFLGSCLTGNGLVFGTNFIGGSSLNGLDVRGNGQYGVLFNGGKDHMMVSSQVGDNSQLSNALYHGILIAAGVSHISLFANKSGDTVWSGANKQGYGLYVLPGAGAYIKARGNNWEGNVTGRVMATGVTGANNDIQTT